MFSKGDLINLMKIRIYPIIILHTRSTRCVLFVSNGDFDNKAWKRFKCFGVDSRLLAGLYSENRYFLLNRFLVELIPCSLISDTQNINIY